MKTHILLTGGLGLVGSELLRRLIAWELSENKKSEITLLIRPKGAKTAQQRFNALIQELIPHPASDLLSRITVLQSQLELPFLGLSQSSYLSLTHSVDEIFHLAADVRFDLPLEQARRNNVLSTQNLLQLAKEIAAHKKFRHFHYLSTYATAYNSNSCIAYEVAPQEDRKFRNSYEQTKTEAEIFLLSQAKEVPLSIHRASIIGGESQSGWTSKFDTFYLAFKLFIDGQNESFPVIPLPKHGTLDAVTIDFVADALYVLGKKSNQLPTGGIYHLVAAKKAIPLVQAFKEHSSIIQTTPKFIEVETLSEAQATKYYNNPVLNWLLPYALESCQYDNQNLLKVLEGTSVKVRSVYEHLPQILRYGIQTHWGAHPSRTRPNLPPMPTFGPTSKSPCSEPIAIIGLGGIFPFAENINDFWNFLEQSSDNFVSQSQWEQDLKFDENHFKIPPLTAKAMDRLQKAVLLCAKQALGKPLQLSPETRSRTGMILGYGNGIVEKDSELSLRLLAKLYQKEMEIQKSLSPITQPINEDSLSGSLPNVAVGRVMNFFDLKGPSFVVNAGDSSTLAAIDCAIDLLRTRDADLMIAGGGHMQMDLYQKTCFLKEKRGSSFPPKVFSSQAEGTFPAEGVGLFILKRLSDAIRDKNPIYCTIQGVGRAGSGKKSSIHSSSSQAISCAMRKALQASQTHPHRIHYVETHGSGIPQEDLAEIQAMREVYQSKHENLDLPHHTLSVGYIKARIGHLFGASGAASLIKTVLMLHHRKWLPEAPPYPDIPFHIQSSSSQWTRPERSQQPIQAGITTFGNWAQAFHLILEEWHPNLFPLQLNQMEFSPVSTLPPIAIIQAGCILPGANDMDSFWQLLLSGKSQVKEIPTHLWQGRPEVFFNPDRDALDTTYGKLGAFAETPEIEPLTLGIPPASLKKIDPVHRQFLGAAAQIDLKKISLPAQFSLIVGESKSGTKSAWNLFTQLALSQFEDLDEDSRSGMLFAATLARLAKAWDVQGGTLVVDAACASSLAALSIAVRELQLKKQDLILSGGVGVSVTPANNIPFARCHALSATGSFPFDAQADGITLGEGSAVYLLKRLEDAQRDGDPVLAIIRGVGASSDGKAGSVMAPSSCGQVLAMTRALEHSQLRPDQLQFIECHATGTIVGDESEVAAVCEAYGSMLRSIPICIGSVKSLIGHTIGAAGAAGVLKTVLSLKNKTLPPTLLASTPHPRLNLEQKNLLLNTEAKDWQTSGDSRRAGVSAFGFGGTNWHAILEESPGEDKPLSSHKKPRLRKTNGSPHKLAFVFPGHGSPYPNMGIELYQKFPVFRSVWKEASEILQEKIKKPLESLVFSQDSASLQENFHQTHWVQPILLTANIAFYRLLREFGIQPDQLLGHSIGELSAAVAAGMITFEDGLHLSYKRGEIFFNLQKIGVDTGKMAAVFTSETILKSHLYQLEKIHSLECSIANINSPDQVVVSGGTDCVLKALEFIESQGIRTQLLPITVAWHSPLAKKLGEKAFQEALQSTPIGKPRVPILSNEDGSIYDDRNNFVSHLVNQLGSPMNFISGIKILASKQVRQFVEVGPRKILSGFISQILNSPDFQAQDNPRTEVRGERKNDQQFQIFSADLGRSMKIEHFKEMIHEIRLGKT